MPGPIYHLIFDSRQISPNRHPALKARMRDRLGLDDAALQRLFCGRPTVIRRNLSASRARKYAQRFKALGAPLRMVPLHPPAAGPETHLSDSLVVCPNCKHRQPLAEECQRCGLIFRKYRPGKPAPPTEPATAIPSAESRRSDDPTEVETTRKSSAGAATSLTRMMQLYATLCTWMTRLQNHPRLGRAADHRATPPYLQTLVSQTGRTIVYALVALILLVVGMWFARGLWLLYAATQVGERFIAKFPAKAQAIVTVLDQHTLMLPVATILVTLLVCVVIATTTQFLHLARYLYHHRPWWWRLLCWYLPITAVGGAAMCHLGLVPSTRLGAGLALLPTLCLAPAVFDLGQALICEAGDILARLRALLHLPLHQLRTRIATHLKG